MSRVVFALAAVALPFVAAAAHSPETTTLPFGINQCSAVLASVPVPLSSLQARMPAGFTAVEWRPGLGLVTFETDRCASVVGAAGQTIRGGFYSVFWTPARPPDALRVDGIGPYFVGWETLLTDPAHRDALRAAGVPVFNGSVTAPVGIGGSSRAFRVEAAFEGIGTFAVTGASGPSFSVAQGSRLAHYAESADGTLSRWTFSWTTQSLILPNAATGVLSMPEGHWLGVMAGATTVPALVNVASWTYFDGTIEFPIPNGS